MQNSSSGLLNLNGKTGLVVGIANTHSIAYGCARAFQAAGAQLGVTYLNDKAKTYVSPLAEQLDADFFLPLNVQQPEQMEALFTHIRKHWGKLDFLLHSIAFAPADDLHGRVTDCTLPGFLTAMDVSCHSFIRLAKLAEPLMPEGGSLLTVTYYGSERVVPHYNMMGPVKAALECTVKYMAAELGPKGIRVNAISPGPILTRAASGIAEFSGLLEDAAQESPLRRLVTVEEVGYLAAYLASPLSASTTGHVHYIEAGQQVMG